MVLSGSKKSTTLKGILIRAISRERASTERRYSWQENHSLRWCKRLADGVCAHAPLSFARLLSPSNLTRCLSHCERQGRQVALTGHKKRTQTSFSKRLGNRVQITSDGHRAYLEAVEAAFGVDVGYAQLINLYGEVPHPAGRYSPAQINGTKALCCTGDPDPKDISTSYVERQNLNMRMSMRRFTRKTNGHSKKADKHAHMISTSSTTISAASTRAFGSLRRWRLA